MKNLFSNRYLHYLLFTLLGFFLGWYVYRTPSLRGGINNITAEMTGSEVWTCPDHPRIHEIEAGVCPECGKELVVSDVEEISDNSDSNSDMDTGTIHLTKESATQARLITSAVTSQKPVKEIHIYGKVQADERLLQRQSSPVPGRIEKLTINYTGERVSKGQTIAQIYSPTLVKAQQEIVNTFKTKKTDPQSYEAAKAKLAKWKIPESMLSTKELVAMEISGVVKSNFNASSSISGVVTQRWANNGDYVDKGTVLYDIVDLSNVWVIFDASESDLLFLSKGDKISFTVKEMPGVTMSGNIQFIDPVINSETHVSKVRIEIENSTGKLKPEMTATGLVHASLDRYRDKLVIPATAILAKGKRNFVYVIQAAEDGLSFKPQEVKLGPKLDDSYIISSGLQAGDQIVTQGLPNLKSAAQNNKPK
jgi:membrane fusion protein, copper/silver efflux system